MKLDPTEYEILSENDESTVVAKYEFPTTLEEQAYQTESELEHSFILQLTRQGYEHVHIHTEAELTENLRRQIERLNGYQFTDKEWATFFRQEIAPEGKGIVGKSRTIQKDYRKVLVCDDGTQRNIMLINKDDIHANSTQVINQYKVDDGKRRNRYDVTILVNGLPLVHVELKKRGVSIKEAFNQIERYGRESFWAGNALYEYVQLFVISNGTQTKYYSNTTRDGHIRETSSVRGRCARQGGRSSLRTSQSFEFTNYWADRTNTVLNDLRDFTATFFSRHSLLNILTRFCVLTEQDLLLVMRPYQIAATELLLNQIEKAHNRKKYGTVNACGYVWHTTGSGKTLTSFKAAQLATSLDYIEKVLFVVDRKDLDYQTMKEYDRFQKGAANGNKSTKVLESQLSGKEKIIITTIQKLATFIKKYPRHEVFDKEVVIIFDECHRSQFGDMHSAITKKFKRYYMFGFTGTPIFAENISANSGLLKTTADVFGRRLHTYTIVDAIRDHNVLPFRVSYIRTMADKDNIEDEKVWSIEKEKLFMAPKRISNVAAYILQHFDRQTMRTSLHGFNSIFAVQSIEMARLYYIEFKRLMEELPENKRLKVATIFSYAANEEVADLPDDEDSDSTEGLDQSSRDFLDMAIGDYNRMFGTNYDSSADKYPNYYKDVSQRMKNRDIDMLIVVNMFLTGFDATTLNTLWVDKNLRYHGLIQSYSRTNRILNSVKTFGNIICFRNLEDPTNKALALFGDNEAHSTTIMRPFEDYFLGYEDENGKHVMGYVGYVEMLQAKFQPGRLIVGEQNEKEFIKLFGTILRMSNMLSPFDQFAALNPLTERSMQDYLSIYNDLYDKYKRGGAGPGTDVTDDIEFEMELVKQVEVNIDYILFLVEKYRESHCQDLELRTKIMKAIDASPDLRDKKDLIEKFIDSVTPNGNVDEEWRIYVNRQKVEEYNQLITEEHLKRDKAIKFIQMAYDRGYVPEGGLEINGIMPPINPFDPNADRQGTFQRILSRLKAFFAKFYPITNASFE